VVAEMLFGLQQRRRSGTRTVLPLLRGFIYRLRTRRAGSVTELDGACTEYALLASGAPSPGGSASRSALRRPNGTATSVTAPSSAAPAR
jgi:hypothetical protein